jgi:aminopeptidase-like protein
MDVGTLRTTLDRVALGREMYDLIARLYPICRSLTGNGVRQTLRIVQEQIPLTMHEVASGTPAFDWTVPREWNIRDAYVKNAQGERVIDFQRSNLHVVGYSVPFRGKLSLAELKPHLFTLPEHREWIPYRTSYYKEGWGFCLSHQQLLALPEGEYEVCIETSLADGHLTFGEYYLPGQQTDEVLVSCHVCHPSLCNDNLSGIALTTFLAKHLSAVPRRYSYRFLFLPGTIGAITWLSRNEARVSRICHGFVVAGVGDAGHFTYKKSRRGVAEIDRAFSHVLQQAGDDDAVVDFFPYGYDERQFCSPAFNLPMGCVMRTPHGQYPEYHTSADDLTFVQQPSLVDSFVKCLEALSIVEGNRTYLNQNPQGEPQLGRRGLYRMIGGHTDRLTDEFAMLWVLNFSDGSHTLLDIAERSGLPFSTIKHASDVLATHDLLKESPEQAG